MHKLVIAVMLGFTTQAYAQQAPVSSSIMDFSGGLNNFTASIYIPKNESPDLLNVVIDEPLGKLVQRKGYATCGTTPSGNTATNLYPYSKQDGSRYLIVTDNVSIWQTDDCVIFTTIATGLSADSIPRFATVIDNLWVVNGSTYPIVWDGTTATQLDGNGGRPLAPKAKYIAWWKSRVFLANTATDPSGVHFSALVSTAGVILNPATDPAAWTNTNNLIYFARDDGSPIYGIVIYRDNGYVFKETGILRLIFNDEYTLNGINVSKTVSTTGSKFNESIVEMDDGLLRFVGRDGVYAFNGSRVRRISDKWTPTFYEILQPGMGEAYQTWDSATDFALGTATDLATDTQGYEGELAFPDVDITNWSFETGITTSTTDNDPYRSYASVDNWTMQGWSHYTKAPSYFRGWKIIDKDAVDDGAVVANIIAGGENIATFDWCQYSTYGGSAGFTIDVRNTSGAALKSKTFYSDTVEGGHKTGKRDSLDITGITGPIKLRISDRQDANNYLESAYFPAEVMPNHAIPFGYALGVAELECGAGTSGDGWRALKQRIDLPNISTETPKVFYPITGSWESQNIQAVGLTQWRVFDATYEVPYSYYGTPSLTFQIKTAATEGGLASEAYTTIVPGATVPGGTNSWAKVKVISTSTEESISPSVDKIGINWVTGDQTKSAIVATNYDSRYWVAAATDTENDYNTMTMVESKSPLGSYTKFDLPISAITVWNKKLYGSIGNTSKIVQLDYGTTDDGTTITSYWDSRDEVYTSPVDYKSINKLIIDYERLPDNSNLQIGLSNNLGTSFSYKTLDTGAESLVRNTKVINMDANRTLQFRSRIFNNTPGVGYSILGIHTFGSVSNFQGN